MALDYLRRRETFGCFQQKFGQESLIYKSLYSSIEPLTSVGCDYGGIFNLEFSPDGSILIAACEKKSIILFDSSNQKRIKIMSDIHLDSVNCVKFLDDRIFATCSDDSTVALFDIRNLKSRIRTLQGHSNWVKNIEYSKKDCLLVTSGFDGSILTWELNSCTENNLNYTKIFNTPGLMRIRLSQDSSKLIICTTGGYLLLVHDLNLNTLARQLVGFRPNLRRLMQVRNQHLPIASKYDHLFSPSRKSNRLELISDFPTENNAEVISSLQIHPQNWVALSRNNSYDDSSEWLCVHDIQKIESDDEDLETASSFSQQDNVIGNINENEHSVGINLRPPSYHLESENNAESVNTDEIQLIPSAPALPPPSGDTEILDLWAGNVPWNRSRRQLLDRPSRINSGILTMNHLKNNQKPVAIQQNRERLIFYTEELNVGKGFIKELCFSSDGRMICSPFGNGIRLLSFSKDCEEIPYALLPESKPQNARILYDGLCDPIVKHSDLVVSTKFHPKAPICVSGCLQGEIYWYCPR